MWICHVLASYTWTHAYSVQMLILDVSYCNELDAVIARAKVRELKCITVIFECDTRTSAKTAMASNNTGYIRDSRYVVVCALL